MTVLVTGATGTVGSHVVTHLVDHGIDVRALTRSPEKAQLPDGATAVAGELSDIASMRAALDGVDGVFLISPVSPDELTNTLNSLDLIHERGIGAVTYLSVIHADTFTDPSHFAAKWAAERMIADFGIPATILRPGYYTQNDRIEREHLMDQGTYSPPLGNKGVLVVDVRDLGELGAVTLRQRLEAGAPQPAETIDAVAPELLTGDSIAALWADALGRPVSYGGDDLDAFEQTMATQIPDWMAHDFRLMFRRFERDGMVAAPGTDERLQQVLGRPMRSYASFVDETAPGWRS